MTESRKRKFRRDSTNSKTVKAIFKKDDLDDSLSTSDWGLVIDDSPKRNKDGLVKLSEELLDLVCLWTACDEMYTDYDKFHTHLKVHLDECGDFDDEVQCSWEKCTYISRSYTELSQHLSYHGYLSKLKSIGRNVEARASLPKCTQNEKFEIPVVPQGYKCEWEYCGRILSTIYDFLEHSKWHVFHNPTSSKEGSILCCWRGCTVKTKFKKQSKLAEHLRTHTKEKIVACPGCDHLFANRTKLCDHRRRQLPMDEQSYLCSHCSKYFPSERLLRDHMRMHINHYKCSMCEMTCPKPSVLAKHIRYRHLNEKPYKCKLCDYRCVSKHNLDFHVKSHDREDPYECLECKFKCRSVYGMDRHYQKVHGREWSAYYECHNCKKRFHRGNLLTKHLMKVHNYHWPSGHSRFHYKEDPDGVHRLQTVRYETLDVTEEIIKAKTVRPPSGKDDLRFEILDATTEESPVQKFDILVKQKGPPKVLEEGKKVFITIADVDSSGNVLKSETIQSSEIMCTDLNEIGEEELLLLGENASDKA